MKLDNHRSQEGCQARRMMPLIPLSWYYCSCMVVVCSVQKKNCDPQPGQWIFFVLLPKTWTHARIIQQPQSIHATQASMPHNSSVPTKLGQMEERIAITQTAENHATLTRFITQSQTFLFVSFFFSYFCTMKIPQTDSEFSQFYIFLNEATLLLAIFLNWENVKFGLGDHDLVFECDIFNA